MSTPIIVLKAARVVTLYINEKQVGDQNTPPRLFVAIFKPDRATIQDLLVANQKDKPVHVEISDETGEYTTGARWLVTCFTRADDSEALSCILVKD